MDTRESFGTRLARIRVDLGVNTAEDLSKLMQGEYRPEAIRRREKGHLKIDLPFVEAYCTALRLKGQKRDQLIELTKLFLSHFDPWRQSQKTVQNLHNEFWNRLLCVDRYCEFEPTLIPWMLQTERYAYEVIRLHGADHSSALKSAQTRIEIGSALLEDRSPNIIGWKKGNFPPDVRVVFDESVLERVVGSSSLMNEQISAISRWRGRPGISVSVLGRGIKISSPAFYAFNIFGELMVTFETAAGALHNADEKTLEWLTYSFQTLESDAVLLERFQQTMASPRPSISS